MSDRRLALVLFFVFAGFYLLTAGGTRPYGDGDYQYRLARALYVQGQVDVSGASERWLFNGPDGRQYTTFSLGVAVSYGPSVAARRLLGREPDEYAWAAAHRTASALWGALAVVLVFLIGRNLDLVRRRAAQVAVLAGLATQLWVYVHSDFSEAFQTTALLWAVYAVLRAGRPAAGAFEGVQVGLAAGVLVLAKTVYFPLLGVFAAYLLWVHRGHRYALRRLVPAGLAAAVPLLALELTYNWLRTGHPLDTGRRFDHYGGPLAGDLWVGLHGLLASSGKGIFWFNPLLVAAVFGWPAFRRALGARAWLITAVVGLVVVLHARYVFWHGAWSFGPRFLTCIAPLALLPLAWLPVLRGEAPRLRRWALVGLVAVSVGVQVVGNLYYAGHSVHINNKARRTLLGHGPRDGCGHCHENLYPVHFVPAFSPIVQHLWLARADLYDWDDATRKQRAPWAYDFPPELAAKVPVHRTTVDFWLVGWAHRGHPRAGWIFLSLSVGLLALGGALARRQRAQRQI